VSHPVFQGRVAVLATKHQKERVIAPILEQELGVRVVVPEGFDTDQFGTFNRDRPRAGTQQQAARIKARAVLELTGETLAIASEGSFAPHPSFPMIPANRELVLLFDQMNDLELVGEELSIETNYSHQTIRSYAEALQFAEKAGFPEHGLVVMVSQSTQNPAEIFKGITQEQQLEEVVTAVLERSPDGTCHIETDMRALYNPTRMGVIAIATRNLVKLVQQECPACNTPGFTVIERQPGLPCGLCGSPTNLTHTAIYQCARCSFTQKIPFPDEMQFADPAQCSYCNP
jgi:DNA-directed RNA polymerase subunit RPC12/RpoP